MEEQFSAMKSDHSKNRPRMNQENRANYAHISQMAVILLVLDDWSNVFK